MRDLHQPISRDLLLLIDGFAKGVMASRERDEVIHRNTSKFFNRWYLARKATVRRPDTLILPSEIENLYLHEFLRDDSEDLHDHPWPWASLVLSGSYVEVVRTPNGSEYARERPAGSLTLRAAKDLHAIIGVEPGTRTLFATLRKERDWGFMTNEGWILWSRYDAWRSQRERLAANG